MSETPPRLIFVDRLAQRIQFDRWGFLAFAGVGSLLIVAAKAAGMPGDGVAVGAAASMILYAFIVGFSEMGRLRSDQAGDNCYYLGLIYTLTSLAYAIFTFDPDSAATAIVQGFGIALATTILGLILRVFFNQTRSDLVDIEDKTRLELSEAASHLKTSLAQVAVSMNDFSRQTRQSLEEARNDLMELVSAAVEEGTRGMTELSRQAVDTLGAEYETLATRTKRVNTALGRVGAALESQAGGLESFTAVSAAASKRVDDFGKASSGAHDALAQLNLQARELASLQANVHSEARAIDGAIARMASAERVSMDAIAAVAAAMADIEARLRERADTVSAAHLATMQDLGDQLAMATQAIRSHNEALEADLAVSRGKVGKVHAALVEVTETLATQVERLTPA